MSDMQIPEGPVVFVIMVCLNGHIVVENFETKPVALASSAHTQAAVDYFNLRYGGNPTPQALQQFPPDTYKIFPPAVAGGFEQPGYIARVVTVRQAQQYPSGVMC